MDRVLHGARRARRGREAARSSQWPGGQHGRAGGCTTARQSEAQSPLPWLSELGQCGLGRVCQDPRAELSAGSASTIGRGTDELPWDGSGQPSRGRARARLVPGSGQAEMSWERVPLR